MCGRFVQCSDADTLAHSFGLEAAPEGISSRFNIAPAQTVLGGRVSGRGHHELTALHWGLVPSWPKGSDNRFSTINARAETVADIVTDANTRFAPVHDRMPVILDPADYETWLDPDAMDKAALLELLRPFDPRGWTAYPVSRAVNSPRNDSPALLAPAPVPSAKTSADATAPRRFRG